MRPVLGITTYLESARWGFWDRAAALVPRSYLDAAVAAGGVPVLLPPAAGGAFDAVRAIDGLLLSGGADVDPARYGEVPGPHAITRPDRDSWELELLHAALEQGRPVLAVCRGMQLLNVAFGGSLHQHLPDLVDSDDHLPVMGVFGRVDVRVAPDSRLAGIIGTVDLTVSCHHHQAVRELGAGLVASAWAVDGSVEAIEHPGHSFVLGVQWHPEEDVADVRLLGAFARAAMGVRSGR
jgi:gamma-glutamyl-gamma-aminobutyrate hydrolase PuuD